MPPLRFPNPVSDIQKFWNTFRILYDALKEEKNFGHDEMTEVMIKKRLATSSGAVGAEAQRRSYRVDRSRDPLYNQLKMYSELFRMLGWLHPGKDRTHFVMTELGGYIADGMDWHLAKPLVKECVLNIVFPNPHVENRGGQRIRPFPFLLKLMNQCNDVIFRDELIIGVLCVDDDRDSNSFDVMTSKINRIRGDYLRLLTALQDVAGLLDINTLQNYTRFPLGVLKSSEWAESVVDKNYYSKSMTCYRLTEKGIQESIKCQKFIDIRMEDLSTFSSTALYNFILLSNYSMLERAHYPISEVLVKDLVKMEEECCEIFEHLKIPNRNQLLFSPFQQVDSNLLFETGKYEKNNYLGDIN